MIHTQFQSPRYNGVSEATTVRQASTALLTINSADRFANQIQRRNAVLPGGQNFSAYDFTITKNESIMNGFFTRIAVSEVVFPWPIPNINGYTYRMQVRIIDASGGDNIYPISIDLGFYTPSQIAGAVEQAVIATGAPGIDTFEMTYGEEEPETTFVYRDTADVVKVGFLPISYADDVYNNNTQIMQLFDLMGFNAENETPETFGSGQPTMCQSTKYVDIVCNQLTYNQALKDTSSQRTVRDALCRIYLGTEGQQTTITTDASDIEYTEYVPPGCTPTTIYRNYSQPKQIQWTPNQPVPGYLTFQVYDDAGLLLSDAYSIGLPQAGKPLNPGLDWSMTLLVSEN